MNRAALLAWKRERYHGFCGEYPGQRGLQDCCGSPPRKGSHSVRRRQAVKKAMKASEGHGVEAVRRFREGMISDKVAQRILWLSILFFIIFFGVTILSYYLLPEGLLLGKNRISDFKTSENLFLCTAQIFLYNMLSVAFILVGSMFAKRNAGEGDG